MDRPEGNRNYQVLAAGVVFLAIAVVMVGVGLLLLLTHLTDMMVFGALFAVGGVIGPGLLGLLMIRAGASRNWSKGHSAEPRVTPSPSGIRPTAASQRQFALVLATMLPLGAIVSTATQVWAVQLLNLGRQLALYGGGILLGLATAAVIIPVFRDADGKIFSMRSMERLPPQESGRRKGLRLAGILLPVIPLYGLYQLAPDLQMAGGGWLAGYSFVIGGLLWFSYLRERRRAT